jgi:hypothetical protein
MARVTFGGIPDAANLHSDRSYLVGILEISRAMCAVTEQASAEQRQPRSDHRLLLRLD